MAVSQRYTLTSQDVQRWAKNMLVFAGPALIVLLADAQQLIPSEAEYGVLFLYLLNVVTDLLKKWIADNRG